MKSLVFRVLDPPMGKTGHTHSHAHILLPLTTCLHVRYQDEDYEVTNQDICFIPPYCSHHCYCPAEVITMDIPPHMITQSDLTTLEHQIVYPIENNLVPLTQLIKSEVVQNPNNSSMTYLFYYLYSKLVELNECRSLRYIRNYFNTPISIELLAKLENYTPAYFTAWFHKKTGQSPSAYLRWFRIERSNELLISTSYSLLDIALQVGYNSHASFTRAFKEVVGTSPQEYRQKNMFPDSQ